MRMHVPAAMMMRRTAAAERFLREDSIGLLLLLYILELFWFLMTANKCHPIEA